MSTPHTDSWLLEYQKKWIADESRIKIMEKSRQVGATLMTAFECVRKHAISQNIDGKTPCDTWVSSRDENQAQLFISDCQKFAKILQIATKARLNLSIVKEAKQASNTLEFANGSKIVSLSSNPDAQAGKRGSRILDEFALHPDPQQLYAIAYPGITWGGQLEIISTHRGTHNFFNQLIKEITLNGNPKQISLHRVTLEDALNQGLLKKLKRKLPKDDPRQTMSEADYFDSIKNSCPDNETFLQEYMCEPMDESSIFLPMELIEACLYARNEPWEIDLFNAQSFKDMKECYLGIDIGRNHDLTVFWLMEKVQNVFFTRKVLALQNTPFNEQENILKHFLAIPSLKRICIDQTGIGRQFTEEAQRKFGKYRVEGVTFTNSLKESLAYSTRTTFENRHVRIPDSRAIITDLRAIKREFTSAGNLRFAADRGKNGHSDHFWALCLALHASQPSQQKNTKAHFERLEDSSNSPRKHPIL